MMGKKHGESILRNRTTEYVAWQSMLRRCYYQKSTYFKHYGGRGITVCDRWRFGEDGKSAYQCFLEDMGRKPTPTHSIDRYPNPDGNYEPENVRWATRSEQARNRRSTVWIEFNGQIMSLCNALKGSGNSDGRYRKFQVILSQERDSPPSPQQIFDVMLATPRWERGINLLTIRKQFANRLPELIDGLTKGG